jgi:ferric-dicitrate binding protein FerR (iron transport regulator)
MADLLDILLFDDEASSADRDAIRERFEEEPDLARTWRHWRRVRAHVRDRLDERVPDRRLLVLYVLDQEGDDAALTASERAALDAARDDIARAVEQSPALEQIVERIRAERADFEAAWAEHAPAVEAEASAGEAPAEAPARGREDRAARAPRHREDATAGRWTRRFALASLIIGIAVGALLFWPDGPSTTTVTVADGEVTTVELDDGASTARVVGTATLTYPTSTPAEGPRRVTLEEGRAYFDVQRRADGTSFVVETPTATATVLGTQFGVTTTVDTTEVVLASGAVRVASSTDADEEGVVLEPGQKSWVAKGTAPAPATPADLTSTLDWTGLFVFRSLPMRDIADRLEAHYDAPITVADALADEPVTGTFEREQPVRQVLDALASTLGASVQKQGDTYRVAPR